MYQVFAPEELLASDFHANLLEKAEAPRPAELGIDPVQVLANYSNNSKLKPLTITQLVTQAQEPLKRSAQRNRYC